MTELKYENPMDITHNLEENGQELLSIINNNVLDV